MNNTSRNNSCRAIFLFCSRKNVSRHEPIGATTEIHAGGGGQDWPLLSNTGKELCHLCLQPSASSSRSPPSQGAAPQQGAAGPVRCRRQPRAPRRKRSGDGEGHKLEGPAHAATRPGLVSSAGREVNRSYTGCSAQLQCRAPSRVPEHSPRAGSLRTTGARRLSGAARGLGIASDEAMSLTHAGPTPGAD